ncbi:MAG: DNA polymerase III subunit gamma/tau [Thermodesulfobacteriota bacterium]|nr:DNA polymerase III subunit gamma/tau [Thermodesulfobacteriota bacterium]
MSQSHLTVKYRPRRFSEVAGQETIRAVLSRAAATDKIAPAYMFSGTRGVGKTTMARIFAKAVNCEHAPIAEPCCECAHCRQIMRGACVDVAEIDAASHTGVDNIRSLREDVGYAPLECRYKVFIIDEAHMLSKSAFNALLKTLEEPPGRVVFILATTEPHKFPATIISRCQHYTFQRLPQKEIEAHLVKILEWEKASFEPGAVALLARRGGGSVRDAMSLMGQVLALGRESLTAKDVRQILGLAGQEVFFRLMKAVHEQDCLGVSNILREILDQGLDLGFFLSELTSCFRNLFLLAQAGEDAFAILEVPDEEAQEWLNWVPKFTLPHIHACWQLTLEGQRRVLTSLEPALALELLLLNLAYLPRLLSLEDLSASPEREAPLAKSPKAPKALAKPEAKSGAKAPVKSEAKAPSPKPAAQAPAPAPDIPDPGPSSPSEPDRPDRAFLREPPEEYFSRQGPEDFTESANGPVKPGPAKKRPPRDKKSPGDRKSPKDKAKGHPVVTAVIKEFDAWLIDPPKP